MPNDPDLQGVPKTSTNPAPPEIFTQPPTGIIVGGGKSGGHNSTPSAGGAVYTSFNGSKLSVLSVAMVAFVAINSLFLLVAAAYAVGILENPAATTDITSFIVIAIMTFISGGFGLFCAYLGLRFARLERSAMWEMVFKILFVAVALLMIIVLVGTLIAD